MKNDPTSSLWDDIAAQARPHLPQPTEEELSAPYGFATRLVSQWEAARTAEAQLSLWQRLAWRGAALVGIFCLAAFLTLPSEAEPNRVIVPLPSLGMPAS
jgi:hypothetical protein